jgi:hypothetical protein
LVKSHSGVSQGLASGVRAVAEASSAFACTRAASRFFHNSQITLRDLADPLIAFAREEAPRSCDDYILVVHDWSPLSFLKHHRKQDRIGLSQGKIPEGYEIQSALALSDRDGLPMAPLAISLRAADGMHCSRAGRVREPLSPLDELDPTMSFVEKQSLGFPTVHIVDAEADSVAHYRQWSSQAGRLYLVRGDDRLVEFQGQERKCSDVQQELRAAGGFHYSRHVLYKGQKAQQFVAEVPVRLLRPGQQNRPHANRRQRIPGEPLPLRLVIAEVRSSQGQVLATWFLLTNAPATVHAHTIALWYYWRWRTETFFKLLKSAGVQAEQWQQETAGAIARRLLVACMACVMVWRLAHSTHARAPEARRLLVRLSGRQMKHRVEYTFPALLAGLGILLAMLETFEQYSVADLQTLSQLVLGQPP